MLIVTSMLVAAHQELTTITLCSLLELWLAANETAASPLLTFTSTGVCMGTGASSLAMLCGLQLPGEPCLAATADDVMFMCCRYHWQPAWLDDQALQLL